MPDIDQKTLKRLSLEARKNLKFDTPLEPDSDQLVELNAARGLFREEELLWKLHVVENEIQPFDDPLYMLFGGHVGCGKTTELKRLAKTLHDPKRYFVVFVDALSELDINNLYYSDILLVQAKLLFAQLKKSGVTLDQVFLDRLETWFATRIETHENLKSLGSEIKAGIEVKQGMPFLGGLFAKMSAYIRTNNTYRHELRLVIRNSFGEFSEAYNHLIEHAEEKLQKANLGQKLLFITDGTDRLQGEDARRFFVEDVYQLKQIRSHFIYCAPIHLLSESGLLRQHFLLVRLPMIKLMEKNNPEVKPKALNLLRQLIDRRMDHRLFDGEATLNHIIWHSGGHVRDLIRLMDLALGVTLGRKQIDENVANKAIDQLATEYRRLIHQEDYALLVEIDQKPKEYTPTTEKTRQLLYDLALLEYNSYWWQTHPVVRTLPAYQKALKEFS